MHIIRVYKWSGGLHSLYKGLDAEKHMLKAFGGEPDPKVYHVLR